MMRRLTLDAMLRLHVQLLSHLIAIVSEEVVVERLTVAGNAATDGGSVCREDGGNGRYVMLQIQSAKARHPFVSLIDDLFRFVEEMIVEALHNTSGSIREHRCLVVVAISMEAVHLILGPQGSIDIILLCKERTEIHQHDNGFSWNLPASDAQRQAFFRRLLAPVGPQAFVFHEKGILFLLPKVRTDEDDAIGHDILQSFRACRKDGVYTTYLIAYFPTGLKNIIWEVVLLNHLP